MLELPLLLHVPWPMATAQGHALVALALARGTRREQELHCMHDAGVAAAYPRVNPAQKEPHGPDLAWGAR